MWPINVRVAPEGSTEDERQHRYWYSFVSLTTKSPPPQPVHKKRSGVSLWVFSPPRWDSRPGSASFSAAFFNFQQLFSPPPSRSWAQHDVQEAEEGELQRARERTHISRRRHLFPLVKVRQLQDCGVTEQLLGGVQLQDFGLFWRDAAQKLKEGEKRM